MSKLDPQVTSQLPVELSQPLPIGKVASPVGSEATSEEFAFWVPEDRLVEKTQIIKVTSNYAGRSITFHGVVDEVYRRSRRRDVMEEADRFGGDVRVTLPLDSQGVTYARAKILGSAPPVLTPPREESEVYLGGELEARAAYGVDQMGDALPIGLLKNGGDAYAGPAYIDLDYMLGENGAHLNVNGVSGAATKSSFLMCLLYALLAHCRSYAEQFPMGEERREIVPIVLNVKGFDLMWLDERSRRYRPDLEDFVWKEIGVSEPGPFEKASFLAPEQAGARASIAIGRTVQRYSWSLSDVIEAGLFPYLFADEDREDENFLGLLQDIEAHLSDENDRNGRVVRRLRDDRPDTFEDFLKWVHDEAHKKDDTRDLKDHHGGTWRKFYRRLRRIVNEGEGVLVRHGKNGSPINVVSGKTTAPRVIDLSSIRDAALQRFVVAAVFAQVSDARIGADAVPGLAYLIVLDELNRFAPKGATDPITRLIEKVVAEMRSQGVILLGGQQQASQVSPRVIENSAIRVLGRTGALELEQSIWSFLGRGAKRRAASLLPSEKLVYQINFREPMQIRMPFPCWAMRRDEVALAKETSFDERDDWEKR